MFYYKFFSHTICSLIAINCTFRWLFMTIWVSEIYSLLFPSMTLQCCEEYGYIWLKIIACVSCKGKSFYAHCTWRYAGIICPIAGLELTRARYKRPIADLDLHRLWKIGNRWQYICSYVFYYVLRCFLLTESSEYPPKISTKKVTLSMWGC